MIDVTTPPGPHYAQVIQLGHVLTVGMPRPPLHPPYMYSMSMGHDWTPAAAEPVTGTADSFAMGTHVGTHVDSVYHIAERNRLHGDIAIGDDDVTQTATEGLRLAGRENFAPIVASAVLLDITALLGVDRCPDDTEVDPPMIERALARLDETLHPGDVVLFRTGWDQVWDDHARFVSYPMPGITLDAAKMLRAAGVRAVGSDTPAFEKVPALKRLAGHAELLVTGGIPIFECLALHDLARAAPRRFQFVSAPLRLAGATGCPVNPLALLV